MTTLPNMGLVLPTRGAPGAGVWDDTLDANLTSTDAHNHIPGAGAPVPTAGLNINADLTFSSLYAPTNLHRITFASIVALTGSNKSLFVNAADNELYWRNNVGTNVKLTLGNALNVGAFVGGIGGDYSAVGAALNFDDAGDRYTLKQQGNVWARMASGDVRLFETGSTDAVFVGLAAPAALASSYTLTMPLVLPGSTSIVQMDSAGVITASTTINNVTVNASGLVTASAGVTCAVNQSVTVSGTGDYKHGAYELSVGEASFCPDSNSAATTPTSGGVGDTWTFAAPPGDRIMAGIPLRTGDRIISITWFFNKNSTAANMAMVFRTKNNTTLTDRDTLNDGTSGAAQVSVTRTINYTLVSGDSPSLRVNATSTAHRFSHVIISYDRP